MSRIYINKAIALINAMPMPAGLGELERKAFNSALAEASTILRKAGPDAPEPLPKSDQELDDEAKFERVIAAFEGIAKSAESIATSLAGAGNRHRDFL